MADSMEQAYRRDYRAKAVFDDAARALTAVLANEEARARINADTADVAELLAGKFKQLSAGVVRTWD